MPSARSGPPSPSRGGSRRAVAAIVFHLRPGPDVLGRHTTSRPSDVVRSWLRIIDPNAPSPLDEPDARRGRRPRVRHRPGSGSEPGRPARGRRHRRRHRGPVRPGAEFVDVVASPTFGIVPPGVGKDPAALLPGDGFVASGGYVLADENDTTMTLEGEPERTGPGRRPSPRSSSSATSPAEARWRSSRNGDARLHVDRRLRRVVDRLRQGRSVRNSSRSRRSASSTTASMSGQAAVRRRAGPPGVRGWPSTGGGSPSWGRPTARPRSRPRWSRPGIPESQRHATSCRRTIRMPRERLLAEAGYPGGAGFPDVTFMTGGGGARRARSDRTRARARDRGDATRSMASARTSTGSTRIRPQMWSLSWVADYPGRNDFLGILLGTGSSNNYGAVQLRPSSTPRSPRPAPPPPIPRPRRPPMTRPRRSSSVTRRSCPLDLRDRLGPRRDGLLGAGQNGLGMLRMAGMAGPTERRAASRRARRGSSSRVLAVARRSAAADPSSGSPTIDGELRRRHHDRAARDPG